MAPSAPPLLSVKLAVDPIIFTPQSGATLTITATSHATEPITIFTWPTIFNLSLAQRRASFYCTDLATGESLELESTKGPKRPGFSRETGGRDDAYFHTLEPGLVSTFSGAFSMASRSSEAGSGIVPGHRYRFGVRESEAIAWWRFGRREEVMSPSGEASSLGDASGDPIVLNDIAPVEFLVVSSSAA